MITQYVTFDRALGWSMNAYFILEDNGLSRRMESKPYFWAHELAREYNLNFDKVMRLTPGQQTLLEELR